MTIIKEKNGTWTIDSLEKCSDGKFHHMKVKGYTLKSAAKNDYLNQRQVFIKRIDSKITNSNVKNYDDTSTKSVTDEWLLNYKSKNKLSTYLRIERIVNNKILTYFDPEKSASDNFTETNVKMWKIMISNEPFTTNYINAVISTLRDIIDRAIRRDKIDFKEGNKCFLILDSIKRDEIKENKADFWTPDEYKQFIATFSPTDKFKVLFDTFYYCGLRMGELTGLQWKHFNVDNHTLYVCQQANNKLGMGHPVITTPKTKNAVRLIDLNNSFYNELLSFKNATCESDDDFIFFGKTPHSPTNIRRKFDEHITMANVKKIRIHDLRHSSASLFISMGADVFYLMKRFGHASYNETMAIYGHLLPQVSNSILSTLDAVIAE